MCVDCYRNDDDYVVLSERPVMEPLGESALAQRMEAHRDGVTADEYEQMLERAQS
jgi:hypothetical protein